ncbi:hypothetical protein ACHAWF_018581, partial [Thalassiosira exigua]
VLLNIVEDRLIGSADLEESVKTGKTVFSPGLLTKAHHGVLYIDDVNLLDEETANILLNFVTEGRVVVEHEGISLTYPCRPLLIATFNPDEGELRDHLLDCIAVALSADAERMEIKSRVLGFNSGGKHQATPEAEKALEEAIENEDDLKTTIVFAREFLKDVKIAPSQIQYLCEEAIRAGCQGHRAEIFACEVARGAAALEGRQITVDDLRLAVKLAIAPRGTFVNTPMDEDEMMPPPPPPPPPPPMDQQDEDSENEEEDQEEQDEPDENEEDDQQDQPDVPEVPQEFMIQPRQVGGAVLQAASVAEDRARAAMEAEESASEQVQVGRQADQMMAGGRPFPLSMVVGQEPIKQALLLSAINNRMGGVVISGGKGTAKSVMARALHQLLPPIEVINSDSTTSRAPNSTAGRTELDNGGVPLAERETEVIPAPFLQVPLNVMEDRLIGSADLKESVKTGKTVFSPGMLAKAHRGVLYLDDVNLLNEETANILLNVVTEGRVVVERASAPYQKGRRARAVGTKNEGRGVFIEQSDVRTKKMARKAGSLIIFVVDALGSMALNRMNAAKGAGMSLLTEEYQPRDQICLIPFQGERADVLLPPTRSIAQAKKRLEVMPCGGGSPLADALQAAMLTGLNAQKTGDVGKVVVVCISDGRANVPLCVSKGEELDPDVDEDSKDGKPSRSYLKEEVLACAKQLRAKVDREQKLKQEHLAKVDNEIQFKSQVHVDHKRTLKEQEDMRRRMSTNARAKQRRNNREGKERMKLAAIQEDQALFQERHDSSIAMRNTKSDNAEKRRNSFAFRNGDACRIRELFAQRETERMNSEHESYELKWAGERDADDYKKRMDQERRESFAFRNAEGKRIRDLEGQMKADEHHCEHESYELKWAGERDADDYKKQMNKERRESLQFRNQEAARHDAVMKELRSLAQEKEHESYLLKWAGENDARQYVADQAEICRQSLCLRGKEHFSTRMQAEKEREVQSEADHESHLLDTAAWQDVNDYVKECNRRKRLSLAFRAKEKRRHVQVEKEQAELKIHQQHVDTKLRSEDARYIEMARLKEQARIALDSLNTFDEVLACAKQLGVLQGFNLLCIDTENKFISTGVAKDIADAAMGKYHQIAKADGSAIASVTSQALNAIKNE